MFSVKKEKTNWRNWSASVHCHDVNFTEPDTLEDLGVIVKDCNDKGRKIRVVGAGHSFTPLVATDDILLSVNKLSGLISLDEVNGIATVWGGTDLKWLGEHLFEKGFAMENLGDINEQTIAGAVSTGTHGTGTELGNIPSQIRSVTMMTATGELLEISPEVHPEWLNAVKISLGLLGIIVKVELHIIPAYVLSADSYRMSVDDCLQQVDHLKEINRNFEFYWFPHTKTVQVKTMNLNYSQECNRRNKQKHFLKKVVVENGLFWMMSETSRMIPATAKAVSTISALGVPVGKETGSSHDLYATPRLVKFQEMEYCIPAAAVKEAMREINHVIQKKRINVHFPIECRFVKKDNIWLSPSFERESAYIAVHMYKGMDFQMYFRAVEEIFQHYGGRPHWGKMHTKDAAQLNIIYPKLKDFLKLRRELDPKGMFVNEYLHHLFGIE